MGRATAAGLSLRIRVSALMLLPLLALRVFANLGAFAVIVSSKSPISLSAIYQPNERP
jgi:hypothetical protein